MSQLPAGSRQEQLALATAAAVDWPQQLQQKTAFTACQWTSCATSLIAATQQAGVVAGRQAVWGLQASKPQKGALTFSSSRGASGISVQPGGKGQQQASPEWERRGV